MASLPLSAPVSDTEHRRLAQRRYDEYRKSTLIATNASLCPPGVSATEITNQALDWIDHWDKYDRRDSYWDWRKLKQDHGRLYPSALKLLFGRKVVPLEPQLAARHTEAVKLA